VRDGFADLGAVDVFGKRFQKELEQFKKDAAKWQNSPTAELLKGASMENIPHLDSQSTGHDSNIATAEMKERNATTGSLPVNA
jgi:hypothetical protein